MKPFVINRHGRLEMYEKRPARRRDVQRRREDDHPGAGSSSEDVWAAFGD
jgi:hypothetical protein